MNQKFTGPFSALFGQLKSGDISRRDFIERSVGLGMGVGVALYAADAVAQDATPGATPGATAVSDAGEEGVIPTSRTEGENSRRRWRAQDPAMASPQPVEWHGSHWR